MSGFKVFDADQVTMAFMGIPISSGYADGEFLTIEQEAQDFEVKVGTDGEVTRSKTNNRHAIIKVKLMQTSTGNAALSALNNIDVATSNGAGVGPMLIKDLQGTTLYVASKCWIAKPPDVSMDRTATPREWTLECANLVRLDGSN
jgi:hypothetical protein